MNDGAFHSLSSVFSDAKNGIRKHPRKSPWTAREVLFYRLDCLPICNQPSQDTDSRYRVLDTESTMTFKHYN